MKNQLFIIALLVLAALTATPAKAQVNLVYNGDFEIYDTCPPNFSQPGGGDYVRYCKGWYSPMYTTPDYFNACDVYDVVSVPFNGVGFQNAESGNGYAGFLGYVIDMENGRNWWEYIQTRLQEPLRAGKKYRITLSFSLAESSVFANRDIGAFLSIDSVYRIGWDWYPFDYLPQVKSDSFVTDTLQWIEIQGVYEAKGGEQFLTVGHFGDTMNLDTLRMRDLNPSEIQEWSYYFVDNVSVVYCPECDENLLYIPNIFSPNNDGNNDIFYLRGENIDVVNFAIFDRWGNEIFRTTDPHRGWDGTYNDVPCKTGVYFYYFDVKLNNQKEDVKMGSVTLVR